MIKQFKKLIEKVIAKPIEEEKIECAIDENIVDCESDAFKQDAINYYTGVPAPTYLSDDDWFGGAPSLTEKQWIIWPRKNYYYCKNSSVVET